MRVIAAKADSYDLHTVEQGINEILSSLGGLAQYIKPGERVLLKPNLVEGMPPEKGVNTHPWVLTEVLFFKETLFSSSEKCEVFQ